MKLKPISIMLLALAIFAAGAYSEAKKAHVRIVCITGDSVGFPDEFSGAERLAKEYGRTENNGFIFHETFSEEDKLASSSVSAKIEKFAEDSSIGAIVVSPALMGTAEGFRRVKSLRNDIFCLAVNSMESYLAIESSADLVVNANNAARGYILATIAKNSGLRAFVFASSEKSLGIEGIGLLRASAELACGELGLRYAVEPLPDPLKGRENGMRFVADALPEWLKKYGRNTLFFNAESAYAATFIGSILEKGGYYFEGYSPSVLAGFPAALGIDASIEGGDPQRILKRIEPALLAKGGAKRFGTWASSYGYAATAAATDFAKLLAEGKSKTSNIAELTKAFGKYSSGLAWNIAYSKDPDTGIRSGNLIFVFQDTYIFGMGFFRSTTQKIDSKYFQLNAPPEL